jgi:hypothetical protein
MYLEEHERRIANATKAAQLASYVSLVDKNTVAELFDVAAEAHDGAAEALRKIAEGIRNK